MTISRESWTKYITGLAKIDKAAAEATLKYLGGVLPTTQEGTKALVNAAYAISSKYGEAAAALAAEMYDSAALLMGASVAPAIPADPATVGEVAKAINGALKQNSDSVVAQAIDRLVKQAGVDTAIQNAARDGAEYAWIPAGETCAYCLALAANGWQPAGKKTLKGKHAEHVHSNCDCTFAVRFYEAKIEGYNPASYERMFDDLWGDREESIKQLRRELYPQNREHINAQKRAAYAARKERELLES